LKALESDKLREIVDNYTRHFFKLAHCLVVNDGEVPPRSLFSQMNHVRRLRTRVTKKRQKDAVKRLAVLDSVSRRIENVVKPSSESHHPIAPKLTTDVTVGRSCCGHASILSSTKDANTITPSQIQDESKMTPLEKLHAAQRRLLSQLETSQNNHGDSGKMSKSSAMSQKRSKVDIEDERNEMSLSSIVQYPDNGKTPVVFVSELGDVLIAMTVEGMTYPHCVNIVETVLRGCDKADGRKAPILGVLDAVADLSLSSVLIKINRSSQAKRIAFEAARNLSMVGYSARVREMDVVDLNGKAMDFSMLNAAFDVIANTERTHFFDWSAPCICMNIITARDRCLRYVGISC